MKTGVESIEMAMLVLPVQSQSKSCKVFVVNLGRSEGIYDFEGLPSTTLRLRKDL